jgi:uncharacterized protein (DUF58 family)
MEDYIKYLNPKTIAQLEKIELKARLVVEGFITGLHRSPYHGFSVEFSEHRQYYPGDEVKHIDWKVYGRTDKYFIKQYEEETNLRCVLAVDKSASMKYASGDNISKFQYAIFLSAAFAYLLLKQRDAVGLALYDKELQTYLPARSKRSYIYQILKQLDSTEPSDTTGTAEALNQLAERINRRGLVIIMSDFLDSEESVVNALKHFRHRNHEVIVFHILDPQELEFKFGSGANFVDVESGEEMVTQPFQIRKSYKQAVENFINTIKRECYNHNIDYNLITTDETFDKALRKFLAKRTRV